MTIDIKDFRIGSIFQPTFISDRGNRYIPSRVYYKAIEVQSSSIIAVDVSEKEATEFKCLSLFDVNPISLSGKILLNCGFKKLDHTQIYTFPYSEVDCFTIQENLSNFKYYEVRYKKTIDSLNKLQNIFYDLTGLELKVKNFNF